MTKRWLHNQGFTGNNNQLFHTKLFRTSEEIEKRKEECQHELKTKLEPTENCLK